MTLTKDVIVTLVREKPRPGEEPEVSRRIYAAAGMTRSRIVQEICKTVEGECVYFVNDATGAVIPVPEWADQKFIGGASSLGYLAGVFDLLSGMFAAKCGVAVFGSDRRRWILRPFRNADSSGSSEDRERETDTERAEAALPERAAQDSHIREVF